MDAVDLGEDLVVENAEVLQKKMTALVGHPCTLDLRWVERVDAAGLQLLLALGEDQARMGASLSIWPGPALERAVALAGLGPVIAQTFEQPTAEVW